MKFIILTKDNNKCNKLKSSKPLYSSEKSLKSTTRVMLHELLCNLEDSDTNKEVIESDSDTLQEKLGEELALLVNSISSKYISLADIRKLMLVPNKKKLLSEKLLVDKSIAALLEDFSDEIF